MLAKGVKRKRVDSNDYLEGTSDAREIWKTSGGSTQPISLLNISLFKLQETCKHGEPNLRYLVLVANTLRHIQEEMQLEQNGQSLQKGEEASLRAESPAGVSVRPSDLQNSETVALDISKSMPPTAQTQDDEIILSDSETVYTSVSTILKDADYLESLCSPTHLSELEDDQVGFLQSAMNAAVQMRQETERHSCPVPEPLDIFSSGSSMLEDTRDNIFEDIDTSMYDNEPWSPTFSKSHLKDLSDTDFDVVKSPASEQTFRLDFDDLDNILGLIAGQ